MAIIFAGSVAFQMVVSAEALQRIWIESQNFTPAMLRSWDLDLFGHVLEPLTCILLGCYVVGVRIRDVRAWLLLAVLISFSVMVDGADRHDNVMQWTTPLKHLALMYRSFWLYTFPFWLVLFAIFFPEQAEWERRNSKAKYGILVPVVVLSCWMAVLRVLANETNSPHLEGVRDAVGWYWVLIFYLSVVFFVAALSLKLVWTQTSDSRRRLRVLLIGIGIAIVPLTTINLIARVLHIREDHLPTWLVVPIFPLVLSFPLTIAYVTVVERALDVGVVIRQSLQYALARRGVVLLQVAVSVVVILTVAAFAGQTSFLQRLVLTTAGVSAILLVGIGANRLGSWIDRRFFREAYNSEQILNRLAESVSSMVELPALLKTVATRISEALHVSEIAVFLRDQAFYRPAFSLGSSQSAHTVFAEGSFTVQELTRQKKPTSVYLGEADSWTTNLSAAETELLRQLGGQLLLPIARTDRLLGFISLGPKQSEAPYSAADVSLLKTVASQTALSIENSRLTTEIATETAEREVVNRELAIAREVQQRLLPQSYPEMPGLEYCGICRPAREVGGDYYDFIEISSNKLGIAIGDVSGKGVPASLLMASLHASLRGQTVSTAVGIEVIVTNISQLIYAATPASRYATFFYGQYDAAELTLTYVNAGHNAPFILRNGESSIECIRLETGGPPVGLLPGATYECADINLHPGDLLVLFTDGVSEAMNLAEEEWGELSLIDVVSGLIDKRPVEIVQAALAEADHFAGAAPQHDDMTLVVFRLSDTSNRILN